MIHFLKSFKLVSYPRLVTRVSGYGLDCKFLKEIQWPRLIKRLVTLRSEWQYWVIWRVTWNSSCFEWGDSHYTISASPNDPFRRVIDQVKVVDILLLANPLDEVCNRCSFINSIHLRCTTLESELNWIHAWGFAWRWLSAAWSTIDLLVLWWLDDLDSQRACWLLS